MNTLRFASSKAAREALGELLNCLVDVEWLVGYSFGDVYGPSGFFPCLSAAQSDTVLDVLLPWVVRVKSDQLSSLGEAPSPNPDLIYSFSPSPGEVGDDIWDAMVTLEELMRAENRYQYFVGNLDKAHKDIESEYEFVSNILADKSYLCIYLSVLFFSGGPYSLSCYVPEGSEPHSGLDFGAEFLDRCLSCIARTIHQFDEGGIPSKDESLRRLAQILQFLVGRSDRIDTAGTVLAFGPSIKSNSFFDTAEFLSVSPTALYNMARKHGITTPYSDREVDLLAKYLSLESFLPAPLVSVKPGNDELVDSAVVAPSGPSPILPPKSSASIVSSSSVSSNSGWKLLGKIALGAAAFVGAALVSGALSSAKDEEDDSSGMYSGGFIPSNYAGCLPDGTPTFWGPQGGRYYRSSSGRKVYL